MPTKIKFYARADANQASDTLAIFQTLLGFQNCVGELWQPPLRYDTLLFRSQAQAVIRLPARRVLKDLAPQIGWRAEKKNHLSYPCWTRYA